MVQLVEAHLHRKVQGAMYVSTNNLAICPGLTRESSCPGLHTVRPDVGPRQGPALK